MKGWIEIGEAQVPIVGIELHEGRFTVTGWIKGPLQPQETRPVIIGHDGEPIYTCSAPLDVPKLGRSQDLTVILDITLHSVGSTPVVRSEIGKVFT